MESIEDDLALGAPGLPLEAETGLSGTDVLKFVGASSEKPGISEAFQGLDLTGGELPRDSSGFFEIVGPDFGAEEDRPGGADKLGSTEGADGPRFGVADLVCDLEVGKEGLAVGVEDRAVDLVGVEDLTIGGVEDLEGFILEGNVGCETGVEDLEGFVLEGNVGRPVGVAGLEVADVSPIDDDDLLLPLLEEFCLERKVGCLGTIILLEAGSSWTLSSCNQMI